MISKDKKSRMDMRISIENVSATMHYNAAIFKAITSTNLSIKKEYHHADIQIIRNILILSICGEIKLAFEVNMLDYSVFKNSVIACGNEQSLVIHANKSQFKEEFIIA